MKIYLMLKPSVLIFFLLSATANWGSECIAPQVSQKSDADDKSLNTDKILIYAEQVIGTQNKFSLKNNVELRYQGQTISTDIAEYNAESGVFTTPNIVSLSSEQGQINGLTADFDLIARTAKFNNAEFIP